MCPRRHRSGNFVWFQGQDRAIIDALLPAAARAGSSAPADDLGAESSAHGAHSKFAPRRSMAARSTPGSARTGFVAHDHQPHARLNRTEAMDHDKFLIALLLVASPALAEPVTGTIPLPRERPYVSGLGANPQYELGREKYIPNTQPRVPDVVFDSRDQEYMRDQPIDPQLLEFVQKLGRPAPVQLHQQRYLEPNTDTRIIPIFPMTPYPPSRGDLTFPDPSLTRAARRPPGCFPTWWCGPSRQRWIPATSLGCALSSVVCRHSSRHGRPKLRPHSILRHGDLTRWRLGASPTSPPITVTS